MNRNDLLALVRRYKLGVIATVAADGSPQAATVGFAVGEDFELVFDTDTATRKLANLAHEARVAIVLGEGELTLQIEGIADVPTDAERDRVREIYFATWPDGRDRAKSPTIAHVRVRPTWIRVSDYESGPTIEEHRL